MQSLSAFSFKCKSVIIRARKKAFGLHSEAEQNSCWLYAASNGTRLLFRCYSVISGSDQHGQLTSFKPLCVYYHVYICINVYFMQLLVRVPQAQLPISVQPQCPQQPISTHGGFSKSPEPRQAMQWLSPGDRPAFNQPFNHFNHSQPGSNSLTLRGALPVGHFQLLSPHSGSSSRIPRKKESQQPQPIACAPAAGLLAQPAAAR